MRSDQAESKSGEWEEMEEGEGVEEWWEGDARREVSLALPSIRAWGFAKWLVVWFSLV